MRNSLYGEKQIRTTVRKVHMNDQNQIKYQSAAELAASWAGFTFLAHILKLVGYSDSLAKVRELLKQAIDDGNEESALSLLSILPWVVRDKYASDYIHNGDKGLYFTLDKIFYEHLMRKIDYELVPKEFVDIFLSLPPWSKDRSKPVFLSLKEEILNKLVEVLPRTPDSWVGFWASVEKFCPREQYDLYQKMIRKMSETAPKEKCLEAICLAARKIEDGELRGWFVRSFAIQRIKYISTQKIADEAADVLRSDAAVLRIEQSGLKS